MLLNAGEQASVVLPDTLPLVAVISVGPPKAVQFAWPLMPPIEAAVALPEVHCTCVYRGPIGPLLPSAKPPVAVNVGVASGATVGLEGVTTMLVSTGEQVSVVLPDTLPLVAVIVASPPALVQVAWPLVGPIEATDSVSELHCTCGYKGPTGP